MKNRALTISLRSAKCEMQCISPAEYLRLFQRSVPIVENYEYYMLLHHTLKKEACDSFHARLYASLRSLFGETTNDFDDYKCSFGYTFFLKLNGESRKSEYTLYFTDIKGGMNFLFRKVYATQEECGDKCKRDVLREPLEDDFSKDEMEHLMTWFVFYLLGFMDSFEAYYDEPFARSLDACFAIYGYRDGSFFVDSYDDNEIFSSAKRRISERNEIPFDILLS